MTANGADAAAVARRNAAAALERAHVLAAAALPRWNLAVVALEPIKVRENAVFRLDLSGGAHAVLRVHRAGYHSDAALASEFAWMRALEESGIWVPRVIRARSGRDFELVTDPSTGAAHQVDVFAWIDGAQLGSVAQSIDGDEASIAARYRMIGSIMARMHNQATRWVVPPGFARHAWDSAGLVGEQPLWGRFWDLPALTDAERGLLLRARERVRRELAHHGQPPVSYGLIHADLVPENILVNGEELRVIDFDDAGFGWHWFDIATSLYFITAESSYPLARDALLAGYARERPLPGTAATDLPVFMAARATTYLGWVHTRPGTETAIELTPYLIERACAVCGELLASPSMQS